MRAVGYIRVSTEQQVEKKNSLEAQKDNIREYCEKKNWKLVDIYTDGGLSGGTSDRPAYQQMLEDLKNDKFDAVIVTKIDRLSRNIRDFVFFLDLIEKHNKSFISITQNFDTSTPMGRLTLNILASFAQFEREILAERVKEVMMKKALKGKQWLGGAAPLGYTLENKKLIINEEEAELIKDIFKTYIVTQSPNQTAAILNSRGYKHRGGKPLISSTVRRIIENRVYIGDFVWGKKKKVNGTTTRRPEKDWIIVPNVFPPIIDKDTFYRANKILNSNKERKIKKSVTLLSGIIYCSHCKSKMYKGTGRIYIPKGKEAVKKDSYRYYKCSGTRLKICSAPAVKEETLDNIVIEAIDRLIADKKIIENMINSMIKTSKNDKNIEKLKRKRKTIEEKMSKLLDLYLDNKIKKEIYTEKNQDLLEQFNFLNSEIIALENTQIVNFDVEAIVNSLKEIIKYKNDRSIASNILQEMFSAIMVDTIKKEVVFLLESSPKNSNPQFAMKIGKVKNWDTYISI